MILRRIAADPLRVALSRASFSTQSAKQILETPTWSVGETFGKAMRTQDIHQLDDKQLTKLAQLSYLNPPVTPQEVEQEKSSLTRIISWLSFLKTVPTPDAKGACISPHATFLEKPIMTGPSKHMLGEKITETPATLRMREDVVTEAAGAVDKNESGDASALTKNAANTDRSYFVVPVMVDSN